MAVGCIYCKRESGQIEPSLAHIFPEAIGGSVATRNTVCQECNHRVNQRVEMAALESVLALQSLFRIRGRRNKIRRVRGILRVDGDEKAVYLNETGTLTEPVIIEKKDAAGKRAFRILGPQGSAEKAMRAIAAADGNVKWQEHAGPDSGHVEVVFADSETIDMLRPLAAKVAFERFAHVRSADFVSESQYDPVRDFILNGTETETVAGVISDAVLLHGILRSFHPPHHAVLTVSHPKTPVLGAFVAFYGLFFYWVVLSTQFRALGAADDLLVQDPQARQANAPRLRGRTGALLVDWARVSADFKRDRIAANVAAGRHATERFRAAADAFYGTRPE